MKTFEQLQEIINKENENNLAKLAKQFEEDSKNFEQKILHAMRHNEKYVGLGTFEKDYAEFTKNKLKEFGYENVKISEQTDIESSNFIPNKFNVVIYFKVEFNNSGKLYPKNIKPTNGDPARK